MTGFQKIIKYLAVALAVFLSVAIISGICGAAAFFSSLLAGDKITEEMTNEYLIDSDVNELKIDISAADFTVKKDDKLRVETNHKYITCKEENGCLKIYDKKRFLVPAQSGIKLELYIPESKIFEKADINTGAGRVYIDTLAADRMNLDLGAGEITAEKLIAPVKAEIDGGAGRITIRDGLFNNLELDMGIGELNLTGEITGKSSLDYGIGGTNLVLLGTDSDYRIELDKGVGEALLEGERMNDDSVYGSGKNYIGIDGGIGELNIRFKDKNR